MSAEKLEELTNHKGIPEDYEWSNLSKICYKNTKEKLVSLEDFLDFFSFFGFGSSAIPTISQAFSGSSLHFPQEGTAYLEVQFGSDLCIIMSTHQASGLGRSSRQKVQTVVLVFFFAIGHLLHFWVNAVDVSDSVLF